MYRPLPYKKVHGPLWACVIAELYMTTRIDTEYIQFDSDKFKKTFYCNLNCCFILTYPVHHVHFATRNQHIRSKDVSNKVSAKRTKMKISISSPVNMTQYPQDIFAQRKRALTSKSAKCLIY